MIYIQKLRPSREIIDNLNEAKRNFKIQSSEDAKVAFDSLTKHAKDLIRDSLIKEQHGLCAYCMRRIENDNHNAIPNVTIEHYKPKSKYYNLTLDYKNMLAVCSGGRDSDGRKNLCCDASKGDQEIKISPYNHYDMEKIRYMTDGTIHTHPQSKELEDDINNILKLNGERDSNGNMLHDTSTELVKRRREVYKNLFDRYIKELRASNKLTRKNIENKIKELEQEDTYRECLGVLLYFLKRQLKKFS